jgi:diaminopimelate epimerase
MTIETGGGLKHAALLLGALGRTEAVQIDMGEPILDGRDIPSAFKGSPVLMQPLTALGNAWPVTLVNMSNPHAVIFVDDVETAPVQTVGPVLEHDPAFPRRCNIEFVQVVDRGHIRMRVWERGAGETFACGTGASASVVASILNGFTDRGVAVKLLGGDLKIHWDETTNRVHMTGPIAYVYDGDYLGQV